ncbi:hypothetical protein GCM10010371_33740 [Streptomyces subrutilus]|uniref:Uncharacterized protein n=1 Tax=Streptomyces subrutilus TaxID=36818 RepID=A0A918QSJ6_9ACTN|nr:hypothetical protein GCM10010371_33740 [Streptomyces subrutilus]
MSTRHAPPGGPVGARTLAGPTRRPGRPHGHLCFKAVTGQCRVTVRDHLEPARRAGRGGSLAWLAWGPWSGRDHMTLIVKGSGNRVTAGTRPGGVGRPAPAASEQKAPREK